MKIKKRKWIRERIIKNRKRVKIYKKRIYIKEKRIEEYYDFKNPFLRRRKYLKIFLNHKKIIKKCNIKRSEKYYERNFFIKHNRILYSKIYFGFISRLCDPYPRPNDMVIEDYLRNTDYTYSTKILVKYSSKYIFNSYIWKKELYHCMKIKSEYNHKNIIIKKVNTKKPYLYYYIFYERNHCNRGVILVGFYKKMDKCIMMDCRFDKSFIGRREKEEECFFCEVIDYVRKDYKGKIILNDYKNNLRKRVNLYQYEDFSINYSKKYGVSWYESKFGFKQINGTEYYLL
jgi:hypothetical protein